MIEGRVSRINKKLAEDWKIELAELHSTYLSFVATLGA